MGSRSQDRRARKLRRNRARLTVPQPSVRDILIDRQEIAQYLAQSRFNRLIAAVKRQIYRKPHGVMRQR